MCIRDRRWQLVRDYYVLIRVTLYWAMETARWMLFRAEELTKVKAQMVGRRPKQHAAAGASIDWSDAYSTEGLPKSGAEVLERRKAEKKAKAVAAVHAAIRTYVKTFYIVKYWCRQSKVPYAIAVHYLSLIHI